MSKKFLKKFYKIVYVTFSQKLVGLRIFRSWFRITSFLRTKTACQHLNFLSGLYLLQLKSISRNLIHCLTFPIEKILLRIWYVSRYYSEFIIYQIFQFLRRSISAEIFFNNLKTVKWTLIMFIKLFCN